jgi:hypothetical protein
MSLRTIISLALATTRSIACVSTDALASRRTSRGRRLPRRRLPGSLRAPRGGRGLGCRRRRRSGGSPVLLRPACVRILPLSALLLVRGA